LKIIIRNKQIFNFLALVIVISILNGCHKPEKIENNKNEYHSTIENLVGEYKMVDFTLGQGENSVSKLDFHYAEMYANITDKGNSNIEIYVSLQMQIDENKPKMNDWRIDQYRVEWIDGNSGNLLNLHPDAVHDKSEFTILNDRFTLTSWIHRHQSIETQVYKRISP
jgi:hypothetical protein